MQIPNCPICKNLTKLEEKDRFWQGRDNEYMSRCLEEYEDARDRIREAGRNLHIWSDGYRYKIYPTR